MRRCSFPHKLISILLLTLIIVFAVLWWTKLNRKCRVRQDSRIVNYGEKELEARMEERRSRVGAFCKRWALEDGEAGEGCVYQSKGGVADQKIGHNFLQDPHSGAVYCYAHKVWLGFTEVLKLVENVISLAGGLVNMDVCFC